MNSSALTSEFVVQRTALQRKDNGGRVGQVFFEFNLPNNIPDNFNLQFHNYYVSSLILLQDNSPSGGQRLLSEPIRLMKNAYNEAEAQNFHSIHSSTFITKCHKSRPIRAVLFQPSAVWCKIDLRDIKVVASREEIDGASSPKSVNTSVSYLMLTDMQLLIEAVKLQSHMRPSPEIVFPNSIEIKRGSKRKDKKKEKKMQMPAHPPVDTI